MKRSEIEETFRELGIRKVKVGGFDVDGLLRGKLISLDKFYSAIEKGFGFCDVIFGWDIADQLYDNATVTGWDTGYPDALAKIDLSTFRVLPYEPDTACYLVDFYDAATGKPHAACPRNLLKQVAARAESAGYHATFACELEFWVFKETPESMREKRFGGMTPLSPGMFGYSWLREGQYGALVHDLLDTLTAFQIDVEGLHTETGPGVWEAAIRYDDVLRAADKAALFKTTVKQICSRHDLSVTFMAKWNAELPGSSGHLHQSLWDSEGKVNLFAGKKPGTLSELGQRYVAGLVRTAPDLTALYSPFINTYRRYVPGMWAPLTSSWGMENRTCSVRVISGPGQSAVRAELRQTAADLNPYIAIASSLAAGLHGIENALELPPETKGDATAVETDLVLPQTLDAATERLAGSDVAKEMLGEAFVDHYVRTRRWEVREARKAVTDWELARYFESV